MNLPVADPAVILFPVADRGLLTFFARSKKVSKERPPLVSRACASPVLLDEFGVCGTRSKNEKTHKDCELRQVLDHNTEPACVTRQLTRGPNSGWRSDASNGVIGEVGISICF